MVLHFAAVILDLMCKSQTSLNFTAGSLCVVSLALPIMLSISAWNLLWILSSVNDHDFNWAEACIEREEQYRLWSEKGNMEYFRYKEGLFAAVDVVHLMKVCGKSCGHSVWKRMFRLSVFCWFYFGCVLKVQNYV